MNRLLLLLLLVCVASATRCILKEKKDDPEIHVINLGDSRDSSDESGVMAIDIGDRRRKRDVVVETHSKPYCKSDNDCKPDEVCVAYLRCLKIDRQYADTSSVESGIQT